MTKVSNNEGLSRSQKLLLKQIDNDIRATLSNDASRRVLMRIIDSTGVFTRSFTGNSETFYREGRRAVGLDIVELIERVAPGSFAKMQTEALALRQQYEDRQQNEVKEDRDE